MLKILFQWEQTQECREGTSSVAFEVLIMNCEKDFVNLWIFNCLMLNINLFIFNSFKPKFCFPKNIFRKQKRTAVYGRASIVSDLKLIHPVPVKYKCICNEQELMIFHLIKPQYRLAMTLSILLRQLKTNI